MSTLAKVFVVLNLLLAVAFLGAAAAFLGHSDNWKAKHDKLDLLSRAEIGSLTASVTTEQRPWSFPIILNFPACAHLRWTADLIYLSAAFT